MAVSDLISLFRPAPTQRYYALIMDFASSPSFSLFLAYGLVVNRARAWKHATRPMEFLKLMIVYNFFVSLVNVYCFVGFLRRLIAAPSLYDKNFDEELSYVYWVYWLTKVIELLDTVFMILRHRLNQVTWLHVYHHASMLLISDIGYQKYAWAAFAMPLMLNAFVHIFLYLYYGLSAAGYPPSWKKALTIMQIVQFLIDLVHAFIGFLFHGFCTWSLAYGLSMLYLFVDFYQRAYLSNNRQKKKA